MVGKGWPTTTMIHGLTGYEEGEQEKRTKDNMRVNESLLQMTDGHKKFCISGVQVQHSPFIRV